MRGLKKVTLKGDKQDGDTHRDSMKESAKGRFFEKEKNPAYGGGGISEFLSFRGRVGGPMRGLGRN